MPTIAERWTKPCRITSLDRIALVAGYTHPTANDPLALPIVHYSHVIASYRILGHSFCVLSWRCRTPTKQLGPNTHGHRVLIGAHLLMVVNGTVPFHLPPARMRQCCMQMLIGMASPDWMGVAATYRFEPPCTASEKNGYG